MKKIITVWKIVTSILLAAVVILAILLVGVRLAGFQVYTVLSGSMEPAYHVGSLIYVKKTDPALIEAGTPITFMLNANTVATHRVIEVIADESDPNQKYFRTKGDANDAPDGTPVHQNNVLGVPKFSIPYLGYVANFIQNPPGKYIALTVGAVILLLSFLPDLFLKEEDTKGKEDAA